MAELLLAVDQQRVVLSYLRHGGVGVVHVLAVPAHHVLGKGLKKCSKKYGIFPFFARLPAVQSDELLTVVQESLRYEVRPEY